MKKRYTFSTGETIEADLDDLRRLLAENRQYLENYEEVYSSLDDDDYVHDDLNMKGMPIVFFSEEWNDDDFYPNVYTRDDASQQLDSILDEDLPF